MVTDLWYWALIAGLVVVSYIVTLILRRRRTSVNRDGTSAPPLVNQGDADVLVSRLHGNAAVARSMRIEIDGQFVGSVRYAKVGRLALVVGSHNIVATMDWATSPTREFDVDAGGSVAFRCQFTFRGAFRSMIRPKGAIRMDQVGVLAVQDDMGD